MIKDKQEKPIYDYDRSSIENKILYYFNVLK